MRKTEIVADLARDKCVEKIIRNMKCCKGEKRRDLQDLAQDIYMALLEKPEDKIIEMYEKQQLNFFITKMVLNNVSSANSPYFINYKQLINLSDEIDKGDN